jgi:DNA-binding transcriptional LysR family regulator
MEYIISFVETLRLLHFKTVVDAGGLIRASEVLGITGGGLSKSIKSLEDELGYKLFRLQGRSLELTKIGEEFYRRLPSFLEALNHLTELKDSSTQSSRVIRLASFEVFTTYFLADFVAKHLSQERAEIREATPGRMEELVASGHSDIGITYEPIPFKGVKFLKVSKIKMGVYLAANSPYQKHPTEELPFVIPLAPLRGAPSGVKGLDGWPEHLFDRKVLYRVQMMETALQIAHRGAAAVFLPNFVASLFNQQGLNSKSKLVERQMPTHLKPVIRDAFIILRKETEENRVTKKLAKALREIS